VIPKKLRLQNFLSYHDEKQELDFDLFHVACLTGENGAGKSSLMEAIPWCVWGEGRVSDERLLREGESEMRVEFEFVLNDSLYKIIRIAKRKKGGGVKTEELQIQAFDEAVNGFRVVQTGVRPAQAHIDKTLGIDYNTFISSSFIVQGKSNEFTVRSAGERKKILAEILQIDRYQTLSERAKEKAKLLKEKLERDRARLEILGEELKHEPQFIADKTLSEEAIASLELSEKTLKAALHELEETLKRLAEQKAELDARLRESETLREQQQAVDKQIAMKDGERKNYALLLSKRSEVQARKKEFDQTQLTLAALDESSVKAQAAEQAATRLEGSIREKKSTHEQKLKFERENLQRVQKELARAGELSDKKISLLQEKELLEKQKAATELHALRLSELREQRSLAENERATLNSENDFCKAQLADITKKGKAINELKDAQCPLCQSPLTDAHRAQVREEFVKVYREFQMRQKTAEAGLSQTDEFLKKIILDVLAAEKSQTELLQCEKKLSIVTQTLITIAERESETARLNDEKKCANTRFKRSMRNRAPVILLRRKRRN